ncbi:MAG: preprotein translocase subunit YajC, partial [Pseudomonadota bacterium]
SNSKYGLSWISDEYFDLLSSMLPLVVGFGVFYFFVIKPQNDKQEQEELDKKKQLDALTVGDDVVLKSGIKGVVEKLGKQYIWVTIAVKTVIEVKRDCIEVVSK